MQGEVLYEHTQDFTGSPMRDANGCTVRLVPITISRSALGKSVCIFWKNLGGRLSPKKTISGLTSPSALPDGLAGHASCYRGNTMVTQLTNMPGKTTLAVMLMHTTICCIDWGLYKFEHARV